MTNRLPAFFYMLLACTLVWQALAGCTRQPPLPVSPQTKTAAPVVKKAPTPPVETLVLVLSDEGEACRAVANQFKTRMGPVAREVILGRQTRAQTLALLGNSQGPIVALGLEAAQAMAPLAQKRTVVFSLVFNFRDYQLLEQGLIGVSMLPPPSQVLSLLRELNPGDIQLAMPTGAGMDDYVALVRTAAQDSRIKLNTTEVGSDKELLHFASHLDPAVTAFWLLPDNRILSRDTLQKVIAANVKNGRQNIVFTPELFSFGGLISARFSAPAIAETVLSLSKKSPAEQTRLRGTLLQPKTSTLQINADLAKTLGLRIAPALQPLIRSER